MCSGRVVWCSTIDIILPNNNIVWIYISQRYFMSICSSSVTLAYSQYICYLPCKKNGCERCHWNYLYQVRTYASGWKVIWNWVMITWSIALEYTTFNFTLKHTKFSTFLLMVDKTLWYSDVYLLNHRFMLIIVSGGGHENVCGPQVCFELVLQWPIKVDIFFNICIDIV